MPPMAIALLGIFALISFYAVIAVLIIRYIFKRSKRPNYVSSLFVLSILIIGVAMSWILYQPSSIPLTMVLMLILYSSMVARHRRLQN